MVEQGLHPLTVTRSWRSSQKGCAQAFNWQFVLLEFNNAYNGYKESIYCCINDVEGSDQIVPENQLLCFRNLQQMVMNRNDLQRTKLFEKQPSKLSLHLLSCHPETHSFCFSEFVRVYFVDCY